MTMMTIRSYARLLACYAVFGAVHELAHVGTAVVLLLLFAEDGESSLKLMVSYLSSADWWAEAIFRRRSLIPAIPDADSMAILSSTSATIRHAGWIASYLVAAAAWSIMLSAARKERRLKNKAATAPSLTSVACLAATITSLEALWTDLLQLPTLPLFGNSHASGGAASGILVGSTTIIAYCCGNFGVLLLHQAWWTASSSCGGGGNSGLGGWEAALSVLQKMVEVTMLRGAQSGGVVCFLKGGAYRVRVVNGKRTSLARLLRSALHRKLPLPTKRGAANVNNAITLSGHTRFATSSKATLDGTHPQQWTPPTQWRCYCPGSSGTVVFANRKVENFVTHNGDFEFYEFRKKAYDLEAVQRFLEVVTGVATPAAVDSCAVAGMVDVLRTKGSFPLSVRYALCFSLSTSTFDVHRDAFPNKQLLEAIGGVFEGAFREAYISRNNDTLNNSSTREGRVALAKAVAQKLFQRKTELLSPSFLLKRYITKADLMEDLEEAEGGFFGFDSSTNTTKYGSSLFSFCLATIDAFYDNDLFQTMKTFLSHARGSFGLCFQCSQDSHRQLALAARGQTMSIAFFPSKGLVCYGSEQAAVKAGLQFDFPGTEVDALGRSSGEIDNDALRFDLDDLGGEVVLLDFGSTNEPIVSETNQHLPTYELMNGSLNVVMWRENDDFDKEIYHRMTRLTRNPYIQPLKEDADDLIGADIADTPKILQAIQDDWHPDKRCSSLNRLTAFHLSRCLRRRLDAHIRGSVPSNAIDILLTGCEVSLWVAEQFASDLQKAFPKLRIKAISSNKLLGMYGQEIAIPCVGHPYSAKVNNLNDTIVIIVSHSGGTFAPLACSNLLQTHNLFAVTSEWDTQIGKQLRAMDAMDDDHNEHPFNSRIFSTEVGMRPAEPCSVSVAATHQLLTNLFLYMSAVILSEPRYRQVTGAIVSEQDLQILETCNQKNIGAIEDITGTDRSGNQISEDEVKDLAESHLRKQGDVWSEHILEGAKAYALTFAYIFATVISGYPLFYGIARAFGMDAESQFAYAVRALDAALYFWMPQINVIIIRFIQGRKLLHRMGTRSCVIGDIPWVSQAAEAFLSKIFAVSYSIAGLNVFSGNPVDHLVHRHTHRVVRGTLFVCGRPDGRLSALSAAESAVCLSVNQASSIQSLGGTCESITIGHNPFKLPLTSTAIFLKRKRPQFLCERILTEADFKEEQRKESMSDSSENPSQPKSSPIGSPVGIFGPILRPFMPVRALEDISSHSHHDPSVRPRMHKYRSAAAYMGAYTSFDDSNQTKGKSSPTGTSPDLSSIADIIEEAIQDRKFSDKARNLFKQFDLDGDGLLTEDEFIRGAEKLGTDTPEEELGVVFKMYDTTKSNLLDYDEFSLLVKEFGLENLKVPPSHRDERGMVRIEPSTEKYFGENIRKLNAAKSKKDVDFKTGMGQHFAQELYETRIASLQRFVAMTVMFHQMGMRVERFFSRLSFGLLGYRIDRTHSIMRIATTASPISGADVKEQMRHLKLLKKVQHSIQVIATAYKRYKQRKEQKED